MDRNFYTNRYSNVFFSYSCALFPPSRFRTLVSSIPPYKRSTKDSVTLKSSRMYTRVCHAVATSTLERSKKSLLRQPSFYETLFGIPGFFFFFAILDTTFLLDLHINFRTSDVVMDFRSVVYNTCMRLYSCNGCNETKSQGVLHDIGRFLF